MKTTNEWVTKFTREEEDVLFLLEMFDRCVVGDIEVETKKINIFEL